MRFHRPERLDDLLFANDNTELKVSNKCLIATSTKPKILKVVSLRMTWRNKLIDIKNKGLCYSKKRFEARYVVTTNHNKTTKNTKSNNIKKKDLDATILLCSNSCQ